VELGTDNIRPLMPDMKLDAADTAELAEMLQFLSHWLARNPRRLAASLEEFVGQPAYGITQLRQDLERLPSCSAAATANSSPAHDRLPRAS
jgi:hypothetical protein